MATFFTISLREDASPWCVAAGRIAYHIPTPIQRLCDVGAPSSYACACAARAHAPLYHAPLYTLYMTPPASYHAALRLPCYPSPAIPTSSTCPAMPSIYLPLGSHATSISVHTLTTTSFFYVQTVTKRASGPTGGGLRMGDGATQTGGGARRKRVSERTEGPPLPSTGAPALAYLFRRDHSTTHSLCCILSCCLLPSTAASALSTSPSPATCNAWTELLPPPGKCTLCAPSPL